MCTTMIWVSGINCSSHVCVLHLFVTIRTTTGSSMGFTSSHFAIWFMPWDSESASEPLCIGWYARRKELVDDYGCTKVIRSTLFPHVFKIRHFWKGPLGARIIYPPPSFFCIADIFYCTVWKWKVFVYVSLHDLFKVVPRTWEGIEVF